MRDRLGRTALVVAGLAAAMLAVHWASGQFHLAVLVLAAIALALWQCFVPIAYEINVHGVERCLLGRRRRIPWTAIRRYQVSHDGAVFLSHKERHPADFMQATFLPWSDRREEVLQQLQYYLGPPR